MRHLLVWVLEFVTALYLAMYAITSAIIYGFAGLHGWALELFFNKYHEALTEVIFLVVFPLALSGWLWYKLWKSVSRR